MPLGGAAVNSNPDFVFDSLLPITGIDGPWCNECGTDAHILIESLEAARPYRSNRLEISYTCMNCDGFYGHSVDRRTLPPAILNQFHIVSRSARAGLQ